MPFISQESILDLKHAVDIHEVVSSYFPLKKKGANYWACCPFHEEKTPSFSIHPEKQIFHCFGCQKGGDAISFVMEYEKVDYPEAIKILAGKAGITLKFEGGGGPGVGKEEIYRANEWAAQLYRKLLSAPEAEAARRYLARRGVNDETADTFRIGYSADSWDHLLKRARQAGITEKTLLAAGLVIERDKGGTYDRFRGRLMFPIADPRGKVIGFGARTLKDEEPKYINTSETAAFSKGRNFFGLNLVRDEAERSRTLYIVEGYLDVIVPHQAGIRGIVATLGTALTRDHLKILRRYVDKVVLVFDGDDAGRKASERGMDLLLSENVDLFVAELPAGHDPDDCVVKLGPDRLRDCLSKPTELFDYMLKSAAARVDLSTPSGKARVVEETLERLAQIPNEVKREILLQQLAQRFGLDVSVLRSRFHRPQSESAASGASATPRGAGVEAAAEALLALLLAAPRHIALVQAALPAGEFPSEATKRIAERLYAWSGENVGDFVALLETPEDRSLAAELAVRERIPGAIEGQIHGCLETLERHRSRKERTARRPGSDPDEFLRKVEEARRLRPSDHGLLPGR